MHLQILSVDNSNVIHAGGQDNSRTRMLDTEDDLDVWKLPNAPWHSVLGKNSTNWCSWALGWV